MGAYGYEIIGGILIVLSSLVGEQMKPKWKIGFYTVFAVIAIAYSGIGIYLRREANAWQKTERQERKAELEGVRHDMSNLLAAFSQLGPAVTILHADVATVQKDLQMAKEKHDPRAIAELEAKANAAQNRVDNVSKALLGAMVPGTVRQLRSWNGDWSSPGGRGLIANVDYLRGALLQGEPQNAEDYAASALFKNVNGTHPNWDPERAARYLEALVARLRITMPVSDLSATVQ